MVGAFVFIPSRHSPLPRPAMGPTEHRAPMLRAQMQQVHLLKIQGQHRKGSGIGLLRIGQR